MRFRPRFSIRDLLWLTLVVAILVAWWVSYKPQRYEVVDVSAAPNRLFLLKDHETGEIWPMGPPIQPSTITPGLKIP